MLSDAFSSALNQSIEPPEVALDRQDLDVRKTRFARVLAQAARAHHRTSARGVGLDHADRKAVHRAEAVHEPLELIARRCELFCDLLVGNDDGPAIFDET